MALLSDQDQKVLREHFETNLDGPVELLYFSQTIACNYCKETEQILQEVAALSEKITVTVKNFVTDKDLADEYGIDKIPATVVKGAKDYGIRYFGIPSGYEFTSLVEDIVAVSNDDSALSDEALAAIADITEPVHIQVFVTPTCPYCPGAVRMAHSMAIASDKIRADMVESIEFPHLANKYDVAGVPRTIINETVSMEGLGPEPLMVAKVLQGAGLKSAEEVDALYAQMEAELETDSVEGEGE